MTVHAVAANLGGLALFTLPGLALAEWFAALRRLPLAQRLGYAYLLGVVAVGGCLFVLSHLAGIPLRRPAIALAAAVPVGLGLLAKRWRATERTASVRVFRATAPPWRLWAGLAITAVSLGPITSALTAPLADWDGRMTWSPLAVSMRHEGTVNPSVMQDLHWFVVNSDYPPLLPLAQAAVQEMFGAGEDEQYFRLLYAGFFAAMLAIVFAGARRVAGPSAATVTTLAAALPPFLSYGAGGATSAYSDLALASLYGAALVLLLLARPRLSSAAAAGLLLAGAVLTKNEGIWLAVPALVLAAARLLLRREVPPRIALGWLAAAALPGLAAVALLASWRAGIPDRIDVDFFTGLHLSTVVRGALTRLPMIVPAILYWTFRWADWSGFWVLFLTVLAVGRSALQRPPVRRMLLAGLVPLAIGLGAYVVSPSLGDLVGETWDRFLLQGLIPLTIVFACALKGLLRDLAPGSPGSASSRAPLLHGTS